MARVIITTDDGHIVHSEHVDDHKMGATDLREEMRLSDRLMEALDQARTIEASASDLRRLVSVGLRVDYENPGHTRISVFVGRTDGARGHAGQLVLRTDEWLELVDAGLLRLPWTGLVPGDLRRCPTCTVRLPRHGDRHRHHCPDHTCTPPCNGRTAVFADDVEA